MRGWRWFWLAASFVLASGAGVDARAFGGPSILAIAWPDALAEHDGSSARLAALPLRFEPNAGQFDAQISFLARGFGYSLFLTPDGATLALHRGDASEAHKSSLLTMRVVGGGSVQPLPLEPLQGRTNYYVGSDPSKWRAGVEGYARVRYPEVLPGVDVVYYGTQQRRLEYDIVLQPGTDPKSVALRFEGTQHIAIDGDGVALLRLNGGGEIEQRAPVAYQVDEEGRHERVDVRYVERGGELGFAVGRFDERRALVIDPTLVYSTYLGGLGSDGAYGVAVDGAGETFVAGTTSSSNFPTAAPPQGAFDGGKVDVFVTKLDATGSALLYSTYLGGTGDDYANGIAIDAAGEAFITGATSSSDFPTVLPVQGAYGGGAFDAFVTKLTAAGSSLVYSTYVGGNGNDQAHGIAVDGGGEAFLAGFTASTNFPTSSPLQSANHAASGTAFVSKLNAAGSAFAYSTYLGGSSQEHASGIAVDAAGHAFVAGFTLSSNFPTFAAIQGKYAGGGDAFVSELNAAGSALVYSTYLGGSGSDSANGIAIDGAGEAFVVGNTTSYTFPTESATPQSIGGGQDAFLSRLSSTGTWLVHSTYIGGSADDYANAVAVTPAGDAFIAGYTSSLDFPTFAPLQSAIAGKQDCFVTKFSAGTSLEYSTYIGGSDNEQAYAIAVDTAGGAVVVGESASTDFPMVSPLQSRNSGGDDAFVTRIAPFSPSFVFSVPALGSKTAFLAALLLLSGVVALLKGRRWVAS